MDIVLTKDRIFPILKARLNKEGRCGLIGISKANRVVPNRERKIIIVYLSASTQAIHNVYTFYCLVK